MNDTFLGYTPKRLTEKGWRCCERVLSEYRNLRGEVLHSSTLASAPLPVKQRTRDYSAAKLLETLVFRILSLGDKWVMFENPGTPDKWDFVSKDIDERVDVKGCLAARYNGNIFIEVISNKDYHTKPAWLVDVNRGYHDFLLYLDTDTLDCWVLGAEELRKLVAGNDKRYLRNGGDNALGYTYSVTTLSSLGIIKASYNLRAGIRDG